LTGFTVRKVSEKAEASANVGCVAVATIMSEKSPATVAGLKVADLIKTVNGLKLESVLDFYRVLNANGGRSVSLRNRYEITD
jgi:C-terminal processing protease CtpA/Prc